jgi:hypothetical protein
VQLIDTGPSGNGWSFYGDFHLCMHYGALARIASIPDMSEPLVKGTMGHILQAHQHARWQAEQERTDPDAFYPPEMALDIWLMQHPEGLPFRDVMIETFRRYMARYPDPPGRVIGVETPVKAVFGTMEGVWGLWAVHPTWHDWFTRAWRPGDPLPWGAVGKVIEPTLLDLPRSPNHQAPVIVTRRIDLVISDRAGRIYAWDHKHKARVTGQDARDYAMDGQFATTRVMAAQIWGSRFEQATLNLIQVGEPWTVKRPTVPATPWRDGLFAGMLWRKAMEIEQLLVDEPDPHKWPMAQHEQICKRRYGRDGGLCAFWEACAKGPAWFAS